MINDRLAHVRRAEDHGEDVISCGNSLRSKRSPGIIIQVDHRHCRPAANETMLGLRRAVGTEVVHWLGANKPAYKLDPGLLEHPRLSPRAVIGPGARFLVPTFPQRSPPLLLTTAAYGGLRSTPDCRPRRAFLHLSYSYATPFGPAILVTQDPLRTLPHRSDCVAQLSRSPSPTHT